MTMNLIETVTLGSSATSITFSAIPQTYTDLILIHSLRCDGDRDQTEYWFRFNGNASGYTTRNLQGYGDGVNSNTKSNIAQLNVGYSLMGERSTAFNNASLYIPNYAGSTNKSSSYDGVSEINTLYAVQIITAGIWANTSAITSISIGISSGNFVQYSTASLYGILKGSGGATVS